MNKIRTIRMFWWPLAAVTLMLSACGGGGGTSSGGTATGGGGGGTIGGTATYTIGGTVSGLAAGQSIMLQDNGGDNVTVSGNTGFTFPTALANGATYKVSILAQPSNGQQCQVTGGTGTVNGANVTSVSVACMQPVGGYIVGLAPGQSVVLQNNGGDNLTVNANGKFTFSTQVTAGSSYNVSVLTQPANGQYCAVALNTSLTSGSSGIGNVGNKPVDTVRLSCVSLFTSTGSGNAGVGNGVGEDAAHDSPSGMVMDASGNLYVVNAAEDVVQKITPAGAVSTLAGSGAPGYLDATGTAAQFNFTAAYAGIAIDDSTGNLYVADSGNNMIRMITPAGVVTTVAGQLTAGYLNASGTAAQFNTPQGVAVDSSGNIYVADTVNNVVRMVTPAGAVSTFAGGGPAAAGNVDGTGLLAQFCSPTGITVDSANNLYVSDACVNIPTIRKVTTPGAVVTTLAGGYGGYLDATGTAAQFTQPAGLAVDASGNVYVADTSSGYLRMVSASGVVSTVVGNFGSTTTGAADGPLNTAATFYWPEGVAVDASGNVYVAGGGSHRIRKVSATPYSYSVNGHLDGLASGGSVVLQNNGSDSLTLGTNGYFSFATRLTTAQNYNVTVATQPAGQTCVVVNGTGSFSRGDVLNIWVNCAQVSTYAGSGTAGLVNGTTLLNSQFNGPSGLAYDSSGNLYVVDVTNEVIRKITPTGVVSTFAGTAGTAGYADGAAATAKFSFYGNSGLAVDATGNVYVGDTGNNTIRMITQAGTVSTIAGTITKCCYQDGTGSNAWFYLPGGVALDGLGNLYVADTGNNSIRKIVLATAAVTTLAGGGGNTKAGYVNGVGTAAWFTGPSDIAVGPGGILYVADSGDGAVRAIDPTTARVTTLAGHSGAGWMWSGYIDASGTAALFGGPAAIAVDAAGNVFVTDGTVRMITPDGVVTTWAGVPGSGIGYPTPGYMDGNGSAAQFNFACGAGAGAGGSGIAIDASGNVMAGDACNNVIRKITP